MANKNSLLFFSPHLFSRPPPPLFMVRNQLVISGSVHISYILRDLCITHHHHHVGATIGIKCHTGYMRRSKWIKAVTNELGQFVIDLPSHLHAIPDLDKACIIKPLSVPKLYRCSSKIHRGIQLLSSSNGSRVYTAGNITLQQNTM